MITDEEVSDVARANLEICNAVIAGLVTTSGQTDAEPDEQVSNAADGLFAIAAAINNLAEAMRYMATDVLASQKMGEALDGIARMGRSL